MEIALIVAVADNGVIGNGQTMPWHLPRDLAYFKQTTMGCPVIMGRKTFDTILQSLGKPLPGRLNIVVSRTPEKIAPYQNVFACQSLNEAIASAKANSDTPPKIFIIGGGEIYTAAIHRADTLYVTHVHTKAEGNVTFPMVDGAWKLKSSERFESDAANDHAMTFSIYMRNDS